MIAPRLRGSVTPSSATISGVSPASQRVSSRSSGCAYSYGGIWSATPWWTRAAGDPVELGPRRPRARDAAARRRACNASRIRSSARCPRRRRARSPGRRPRSASTTALRPATHSDAGAAACGRGAVAAAVRWRARCAPSPACARRVFGPVLRPSASGPCPRDRGATAAAGAGRGLPLPALPDRRPCAGCCLASVPSPVVIGAASVQRGPAACPRSRRRRALSRSRIASAAAKSLRSAGLPAAARAAR